MTEEIRIGKKDIVACNYWKACDYYKQLKRLEQERDELKKTVENQKLEYEELQCDLSEVENACGCYQSENAELKQENKELKKKAPMKLIAKNNAYRSALEEIRELCTHYENTNDKCITNCYAHFIVTDLIQDKINEVLNEKEL